TPEAVFWAVEAARAGEGAHVRDGGEQPPQPTGPPIRPTSERVLSES
ncbi:MAG: Xanthine dehydrogenase, partial [Klenkia sp.]|nr:Xanthine dehydrogenase [Klenkia sp.]